MTFDKESHFESAVIDALQHNGWHTTVLTNYTESQLLRNWADILFDNNRDIDRLNDCPLTDSEMAQILEQIAQLKTPLKLNGFINGKTVSITRDNADDKLHYGKEVSLKIYDRMEIAAGQSRYQIAQQPIFKGHNDMLNSRRGDLMLLINGMPVIHIELKKSGIPVSQAYNQIEKYAHEGVFSGLFSLVQVFVAMTPEDCVYFANPGPGGRFNKDFYFHWANFNNLPIYDWKEIVSSLLHIPMAHQLIGFYTVADDSDGILKVMRSYQYYAANKISDTVSKIDWENKGADPLHQLGGYVWHTTGSGKTMTSFKSAQLIANSKDADKVVFLMDRVELGTQSLYEYRAFADECDDVQATENTHQLITKLKSTNPSDTLIVTSIQKMSRIEEDEGGLNKSDIEAMRKKRIIFIVDECHRSTFGDMLINIKNTFPDAVFFGFTGTPIYDENKKKDSTTSTIFGEELHRYSIADGIRDGNVLGFDPYKCLTYKDRDLRQAVALEKAKADTVEEALRDHSKRKIYQRYMTLVPMAGIKDDEGNYQRGIEDEIKMVQYDRSEHREMVAKDILDNWMTLSMAGKFHAIFATASIPEAIKYYRLIKEKYPQLKVTALFDSNIDNNGNEEQDKGKGALYKENGLLEIIQDYNERYDKSFDIPTHDKFKKDISSRLSHKKPYERIEYQKEEQLDLLIVVDQMLTGFDSKWVNTLYLDKILRYENIIQAFSRTNRLFGPDKPFGVIRYYRKPHTMEKNIEAAIKYYSGDRKVDMFVERLPQNIKKIQQYKREIEELFEHARIPNMDRLPDDPTEKGEFAKLFRKLNKHLEAARVQGFKWQQQEYSFDSDDKIILDNQSLNDQQEECDLTTASQYETEMYYLKLDLPNNKETPKVVRVDFEEPDYLKMAQRYKELAPQSLTPNEDVAYDIDGYLTEIDTDKIDNDYMNSRFEKYLRNLEQPNISPQELKESLNELHSSFSYLSNEEQKFANIFLHDIESGDVVIQKGKSFREYITEYQLKNKANQIGRINEALGVDKEMLQKILLAHVTEDNLDEYSRFTNLQKTIDRDKAKQYFEKITGKKIPPFKVARDASLLLREFVLKGGIDIE